jgi:hypothetical protein
MLFCAAIAAQFSRRTERRSNSPDVYTLPGQASALWLLYDRDKVMMVTMIAIGGSNECVNR